MKNKNLILLTNGFPYEKGEQFLETEILYLAKHFDKITIYPISWNGEKRNVPDNVEIIKFDKGSDFSVKKLFFKRFRIVWHFMFSEFLSLKRRKHYKGNFKFYFDSFMGILNDAENFHNHLISNYHIETKIYSYWFGPWGSMMSVVNDISSGKVQFFTRIHGYDYDPNQRKEGFIPFRAYQMKKVKSIFSVSDFALNRVKKEYPSFKKTQTYRLGVEDKGNNPFNNSRDRFTIVSCSSLIPLKRVHLMIELFKHIKLKIHWVHFGDGELEDEIKTKANQLSHNISYEFKGHLPNNEIIRFYQNNPIDLFINVSELEGIPVSLMEAISFGIPIMGCNICGVPEIVTNETGILIEKDFDVKLVANQITNFLSMNEQEMIEFRKGVKQFWNEYFNAEKNYNKFINETLVRD